VGVREGDQVSDVAVVDVGVGEDARLDGQLRDELRQLLLWEDGDALRIPRAGEGGGILATLDAGDLGGGEGDDLNRRVIAENDVEVVEVPSGGPHDQYAARHCHGRGSLRSSKAFLGLFRRMRYQP